MKETNSNTSLQGPLLNTELEVVLAKLLEKYKNKVGSSTSNETVIIRESDCTLPEIEELVNSGFFTGSHSTSGLNGWYYCIRPTQKAMSYNESKKQYSKQKRRERIAENIKYIVTTLIALAALAVSIIALLNK